MSREQALDALYTVLVDGISPDDISFTEDEHRNAVEAWNYFRKEGTNVHNDWLAAVDELERKTVPSSDGHRLSMGDRAYRKALQDLKSKMAR